MSSLANLTGRDNDGRPRTEYRDRVASMDDAALLKECSLKIWLSAFAGNNPRSDYHWHTDVLYDECQRRERPDIYQAGYDHAVKLAGHPHLASDARKS